MYFPESESKNGLILMGLEYPQQLIARGSIIILAVAISESGKNKS